MCKDIKNNNYKIKPEIKPEEIEKAYYNLGNFNPEKEVIKKCVNYYIEKYNNNN
jgi:hypothetical protein